MNVTTSSFNYTIGYVKKRKMRARSNTNR